MILRVTSDDSTGEIRYGRSHAEKGFTLFEMLVVLVIMSLSAAFVVPQLAGSLTKMNAKTAAGKIAASLRYARSRAVAERISYRSDFDAVNQRILVKPYRPDGDNISQPVGKDSWYELPDGVQLEMDSEDFRRYNEEDRYAILFFPTGGSSGGRIRIKDEEDRSFTISVDPIAGSVKLFE